MTNEDKEALYNILYAKILEFSVEIEAIKSVLTNKQKAEILTKKSDLTNQIRNSGSLDLILDYLR
ncbi:hypothetical protein KDD93_08970 [Campylobacter sp. faydin G-24]|uniref:Uncharacterized protein n=1 Tax=Campylobacter anatolicus TaxID=2829105 RepID=A0ABS5HKW1_9BACT|nr:hypothetical protein [Campylobacter anatolicus]MBR8464690.1 hypothetical protein [Campylobacter anatolicus]